MIKKAQSLPLNTIVIALLVVIVLVVVVLAFTGNLGQANETIQENAVSNSGQCNNENTAITTLYPGKTIAEADANACDGSVVPGVSAGENKVCCAS